MPFDSTLPINSSQVNSAELRAQFNSLHDDIVEQQVITNGHVQRLDDLEQALQAVQAQITQLTTQNDALAVRMIDQESAMVVVQGQLPNFLTQADIEPITANNVDAVGTLSLTVSNPPATSEVEDILSRLNDTITNLHR